MFDSPTGGTRQGALLPAPPAPSPSVAEPGVVDLVLGQLVVRLATLGGWPMPTGSSEHPVAPSSADDDPGADLAPGGDLDAPLADGDDPWADDPWALAHPVASHLQGRRPGPELAALLSALEPADLDDPALIEAVVGWERLTSWATARQAEVVSELRRRRELERCDRFVGDEIAACLSLTRSAGESKVALSLGLDRLPAVASALRDGSIDLRRALVLTDEVAHLPETVAQDVASAVLPAAPDLTAPQLRGRLRRLEISRDPQAAENRHVRARRDRHVSLTPTQDSMAWLSAYLPADEAGSVYTMLTAVADCSAPEDDRPLDARRADALTDLAALVLDTGLGPWGTLTSRQRRHPHLSVTASATTLLGLDDEPAELAGYGPVPASMARRLAARSTWRPLLVDATTGELVARSTRSYRPSAELTGTVLDRDVTCTFPGCRITASRCDIDHIEAFVPGSTPSDQTRESNLQALCRHHHLLKTHGGWAVRRDVTGTTTWSAPSGHTYTRPPVATDPRGSVATTGPPTRAPGQPTCTPGRPPRGLSLSGPPRSPSQSGGTADPPDRRHRVRATNPAGDAPPF